MKLKVTNAAGENPSFWLYGPIGESFGGITPDDLRLALQSVSAKDTIDLHIHSDGGVYMDGIAMHTMLTSRSGATNVIIDSLAASAASIVAMAGNAITIASGGWMMIHEVYGSLSGRVSEFRTAIERMDSINEQMTTIYSKRWNGSRDDLRTALSKELWMNAEHAVEMGMADSVMETMAIAAHVDPKIYNYRNLPGELAVSELEKKHESRLERLDMAIKKELDY